MSESRHTLRDAEGKPVQATIRSDKRLKKYVRWARQPDGSVLVRVPLRYPKREYASLLESVQKQLLKPPRRARRRSDRELQKRAEYLNRECFQGCVHWEAIRWVSNMNSRLGSCTSGGPTDGHIRISDKIRDWPLWVIDYVIAHEMTHRLHTNHSAAFWRTLRQAYPLTEQARGFIKGVAYAKGMDLEEDI
jgi:predicted metal-dependent hydrolase